MNNINVFSIYSGILYSVKESEYSLLDDGQLPLKSLPRACKKCYDRRYVGFIYDTSTYTPCSCINKVADFGRVRAKFNIN